MDEVARGLGLTRDVRLEISVDAVLHFTVEGPFQQTFEALQTVRVVGQTEFTAGHKLSTNTLGYSLHSIKELIVVSNMSGHGVYRPSTERDLSKHHRESSQ